MIKTKEELINQFKDLIGERTDDGVLMFLEDLADSVNEDSANEIESLQNQIRELEESWRKKYIERFSNTDPGTDPETDPGTDPETDPETFEDVIQILEELEEEKKNG